MVQFYTTQKIIQCTDIVQEKSAIENTRRVRDSMQVHKRKSEWRICVNTTYHTKTTNTVIKYPLADDALRTRYLVKYWDTLVNLNKVSKCDNTTVREAL